MNDNAIRIVMDGQAGSCGKGKVVGYLSIRDNIQYAINNNMSNAGHTFVFDNGEKVITSHLPISVVNPSTSLLIGANAAITPEVLERELVNYSELIGTRKIYIHPRAAVIQEKHRQYERETIRSGSTFKGCSAAIAEKIQRTPGVELARDYWGKFSSVIRDKVELVETEDILCDAVRANKSIIIEGSQGFDLDLNYGLNYPYVTSRQCTAAQLYADSGLPLGLKTHVYMLVRPYPIRISNATNIGLRINSGPYAGSNELSWDIVKRRCRAPWYVNLDEKTTISKQRRRVFEFNWDRMDKAIKLNNPDCYVLNFAQYISYRALHKADYFELPPAVYDFMDELDSKYTGLYAGLIGTGAGNSDIIDVEKANVDKRRW